MPDESLEDTFGENSPDPASDIACAVMALPWAAGGNADEHGDRYGRIQEIADPIIRAALSAAEARGRAAGLEEAKLACLDLSDAYRETGEHHMGVGPQGPAPILTKAAEALGWARGATECAFAILALTTPPEPPVLDVADRTEGGR